MSLYGCCLWSLNSSSINVIEIALNKILRKIWHLHLRSHIYILVYIVHYVSHIPTVSNMLYHRFTGFLSTALLSSSTLVRSILMSLCILHIHLLVTISDMVISILRLSVSLILILVVLLDKFAVIMVFVPILNL